MIVIPTMPPDMNEEECRHAVHTCTVQCIRQITMTFITVISMLLILLNTNIPEPYHTPILYGQGWVNELLEGHPEHICCELGVSCEVFLQLIISLHSFSFGDSKYVQLEEQLAKFPTFQQNKLQIFPSDAQNLLFTTILHSIHQPSQHRHPAIIKDLSQPQNVAIL